MSAPVPPRAKRIPTERTFHGHTFVDEYEWLRDKADAAVLSHLAAENEYTESRTAHLQSLRQNIFDEIKARTKETDLSLPVRRGQWWYYSRSFEGKQYSSACRCPIRDADDWTPPELSPEIEIDGEQTLLDINELAQGHDFLSLGAFEVSEDGHLAAYSYDIVGDERYTLRFKDLRTGELLADVIDSVAAGVTWTTGSTHVYYQTVDDSWRPDTVWRHRIGDTDASADAKVFHEPDDSFWVGIGASHSRKYLFIHSGSQVTSEWWIADAHDPESEFRVVYPRRDGVEYSLEHAVIGGEDRLLVLHNDETDGTKAVNFKLSQARVAAPDQRTTLIEHRDDVRLNEVEAFADLLVVSYRKDALVRTALWPINDDGLGELSEVDFGLELFTAGAGANPQWQQPVLRMAVTSYLTPARIYDRVLATGEMLLRKEQTVLGHYDADEYVQQRIWVTARDGEQVPLSIVARCEVLETGTPAPLLLYGYGSYESSEDPEFSVARLSLLDRGMIFAVAHVRGGGEMGRPWYEGGRRLTKRNTFNDFVDCAQHLIDSGYTTPQLQAAIGGSAGGLLMGAVANLAPELFTAIVTKVPFVDPLTSILDPNLPLTVIEWDEWGNPLESAQVYEYMRGYSPYENVATRNYPAMLVETGLNDTRVLYVEPAKWVAKLRETNSGAPQVLLKTEMSSGHGGVSGRYERWKETAFTYAWLLDRVGLG